MQMKRLRLTLVVALLALSAFCWGGAAAAGGTPTLNGSRVQASSTGSETSADPDTPQIVTKRLSKAPDSDGSQGFSRPQQYWWIGRVLVSVYLGRWFAR
jgi:hypothetical protein